MTAADASPQARRNPFDGRGETPSTSAAKTCLGVTNCAPLAPPAAHRRQQQPRSQQQQRCRLGARAAGMQRRKLRCPRRGACALTGSCAAVRDTSRQLCLASARVLRLAGWQRRSEPPSPSLVMRSEPSPFAASSTHWPEADHRRSCDSARWRSMPMRGMARRGRSEDDAALARHPNPHS